MKVYSIIAEEKQIDELNLGLTKTGRQMKRSDKATKKELGDEVRNLEVELLTYMKSSGNKVVTPTLVKKYLQQKGLGTVGDAVVDKIASTSDAVGMDRKEPPLTRGTTPSNGASNLRAPTAPPAAAPAGAPTLRAPDRNPLAAGTKSKTNSGEEYTWLGAQWRSVQTGRMANKAQGAELKQNAQKQTNSMYSEAVDEAGLSKRQIRNILKQVIEKAYGDNAGFKRSKFGDASASTSSQDDVQGMISKLKAAGYKVSR